MPSSTIETYDVVGSRYVVQLGARQRQLRLRQLLEAAAEADEHQVALVPEHLHERRRARVGHRQRAHGLVGHALQIVGGRGPRSAVPLHAVHQVEHAPAFERSGTNGLCIG